MEYTTNIALYTQIFFKTHRKKQPKVKKKTQKPAVIEITTCMISVTTLHHVNTHKYTTLEKSAPRFLDFW